MNTIHITCLPRRRGHTDRSTHTHQVMNLQEIIATGRRIIATESSALQAMAEQLDDQFGNAVRLVVGTRGRVVVSGMGKSGHVGRKISATLASTGTPAMFVHPAEAVHGDLGMITPDDVLVIISNSGETSELMGIIEYAVRFSIPIIAITRSRDSVLGRAAAAVLQLPDVPEACAIGMAPTTSTTCALALGDALAIALMEVRDFGADDFRVLHPGGPLGAQLKKVKDLMHAMPELPIVGESTPMTDAIVEMSRHGFGILGVTSDVDSHLVGVISDGDLRRHMAGLLEKCASEVMTTHPRTTEESTFAAEALRMMNSLKITCLFVTEPAGHVTGLLHIHDCLRAGIDARG
jgi:arabinose-5-phosphate isomerase